MDKLKDIFFFLGSTLGIIAFFRSLIDPILDSNRKKWERVKSVIDEVDLINLEQEVELARFIDDGTMHKLEELVFDIRHGAEHLRFGPILKKHYARHLKQIALLYYKFRNYVQVPMWEPYGYGNPEQEEAKGWKFNRDYFPDDKHALYARHLDEAADIIERIRLEFRALSVLSNLHVIELPFARLLVKRRGKIPARIATD